MRVVVWLLILLGATASPACDLCAVYRASDTAGGNPTGWVLSVAEQSIPYHTTQFEGTRVHPAFPEFVDSSITHLVLGYNAAPRFGVSLNLPLTQLRFRRRDFRYSLDENQILQQSLQTESGRESGLGDAALILRGTIFQHHDRTGSVAVNLLGGVKFPTGDDGRVRDEVAQADLYESYFKFTTPHDPLGHSASAVHQHMLALGSGSFDGIFGITINANWRRWFANGQFQYYVRTAGAGGFKFGDELMISGGPGFYLWSGASGRLGLQANAGYDDLARDELLGRASNRTGSRACYLGPLLSFDWKTRFSANLGVDLPLEIANHGLQLVPDFRLHGGISWRF